MYLDTVLDLIKSEGDFTWRLQALNDLVDVYSNKRITYDYCAKIAISLKTIIKDNPTIYEDSWAEGAIARLSRIIVSFDEQDAITMIARYIKDEISMRSIVDRNILSVLVELAHNPYLPEHLANKAFALICTRPSALEDVIASPALIGQTNSSRAGWFVKTVPTNAGIFKPILNKKIFKDFGQAKYANFINKIIASMLYKDSDEAFTVIKNLSKDTRFSNYYSGNVSYVAIANEGVSRFPVPYFSILDPMFIEYSRKSNGPLEILYEGLFCIIVALIEDLHAGGHDRVADHLEGLALESFRMFYDLGVNRHLDLLYNVSGSTRVLKPVFLNKLFNEVTGENLGELGSVQDSHVKEYGFLIVLRNAFKNKNTFLETTPEIVESILSELLEHIETKGMTDTLLRTCACIDVQLLTSVNANADALVEKYAKLLAYTTLYEAHVGCLEGRTANNMFESFFKIKDADKAKSIFWHTVAENADYEFILNNIFYNKNLACAALNDFDTIYKAASELHVDNQLNRVILNAKADALWGPAVLEARKKYGYPRPLRNSEFGVINSLIICLGNSDLERVMVSRIYDDTDLTGMSITEIIDVFSTLGIGLNHNLEKNDYFTSIVRESLYLQKTIDSTQEIEVSRPTPTRRALV